LLDGSKLSFKVAADALYSLGEGWDPSTLGKNRDCGFARIQLLSSIQQFNRESKG